MGLDPAAVGRTGEPLDVAWESRDALLYAVAVGAGHDPAAELALTTENTEGVPQRALPSFAALLSQRVPRPDVGTYDRAMLLHAEQHLELRAPLPVAGRARLTAEVLAVHDKGTGAVVWTGVRAVDPATGAPLFSTRSAAFIRGAGGFGGPRGTAEPWEAPAREPDEVVRFRTRPEQALLYRLTGDRNPLHSDPGFAARAGFDRPILHGMCTYGFTARALVAAACGGDPDRLATLGGRFRGPVVPGDALEVRLWRDGRAVLFQTLRGDGAVVIDRGVARLDDIRPAGLA
ncbi:3-hydroxyacyl-thioester dehydratase HtdY [Sphaerisporangium rufum]|uniref:3-hydroxyacyl-thioester dehydratase HtdY n=1 Tax=Sphaerisporangium rufum TaxID=1381558 RepID=A0A919R5A3_9ACTN|nr:MaoC/PaaZ C-terminal domain-containing protein [Sphaerisporangium rufum]GII78565.1 3-hydroxyacyl-thioester dehydratase HtdY [Sphaerisporangium rufum]